MTAYLYAGTPIAVNADTTIRFVAIAPDGTISALQEATFDFPPPLAFAAQPSLVSGSTISYGTYDPTADDVSVSASGIASAETVAILRNAATALVASSVSISNVQTMVEKVLTVAEGRSSVSTVMQQVEQALVQMSAFPTVSDILNLVVVTRGPFIFTAQPSVSMITGDGGILAYGTADTEADDVVSSGSAAATVADIVTRTEAALAAASAVPSVADLMAQIDNVTAAAQAEASVTDEVLKAVAENLLSAAESLATAGDKQLMVDNVTILAESGASLGEIAAYTERVVASAGVQTTVNDVLRGSFIGAFLFADICSPRNFANLVTSRTFMNLCSPRGSA